MAEVLYFVSAEDGKTELSDGETVIGHIETVGLAFEIKPVAGLMLDGMQAHPRIHQSRRLSKRSNCTQEGPASQSLRDTISPYWHSRYASNVLRIRAHASQTAPAFASVIASPPYGNSNIQRLRKTCVLGTKEEAIAAAKTRAPDVIKRHSGREPDSFRLTDANGKIVAIVPIRDWKR